MKILLKNVFVTGLTIYASQINGAASSSLSGTPAPERQGVSSLQNVVLWSLIKGGGSGTLQSYDSLMQYLVSKGVMQAHLPSDFVDDLAKNLYLHLKSDKNIPDWLKKHIKVSVQDLIDHDMIPPLLLNPHRKIYLNLDKKYINDLTGLNRIPGIETIDILGLEHNRFTAIKPNAFAGFHNLQDLYLNFGQLTTIDLGAFAGLTKLEIIGLSDNQLTVLKPGIFTGLTRLEELGLQDNRVTTIEPGTFAGLNNLKGIALMRNKLSVIKPGMFTNLPSLEHLTLRGNPLINIEPGSFAGLVHLRDVQFLVHQLPAEENVRLRQEIQRVAPNADVSFY